MFAEQPVSRFGLRVLEKLSHKTRVKVTRDKSLQVGVIRVPPSLVRDLERRDLIALEKKGAIVTEAGLAYLRRQATARKNLKEGPGENRPTSFQGQHRREIRTKIRQKGKTRTITRNAGITPLGWLYRRKGRDGNPFLNREQFEAGEKLAEEYERAGLMGRTTRSYDGVPIDKSKSFTGSGDHTTVRQIAVRDRVNAALRYVGPGLSDILVRVCCFHEGLEVAEQNLAWPTRSGKLVLRFALDRLAEYYKIKKITKMAKND